MEYRRWERTSRPKNKVARWIHIYATLNPGGKLAFNRYTFERLGEPEAVFLLFDRVNETIGVQAATLAEDDAFPVRGNPGKPGRFIHAARLIREWNIRLDHGVRFVTANFDQNGILILDLRETRRAQRPRDGNGTDAEARALARA